MAFSLLALLDDITTLLDDVSLMSKVAAKKTAGVLGDDLALNAEPVSGVKADRELPVVWAVAKGSFFNKFILVPAALLISAVAPWLMKTLSVVGTAAMFIVGGGILTHGFHAISHWVEDTAERTIDVPYIGSILDGLLPVLMSAGIGILAGGLVFLVVMAGEWLWHKVYQQSSI